MLTFSWTGAAERGRWNGVPATCLCLRLLCLFNADEYYRYCLSPLFLCSNILRWPLVAVTA